LFGLSSMSGLFQSILRGQFAFTAIALIEFGGNAIELAAVAILVLFYHLGLNGLLIAKLISGTFSLLLSHSASRIEHKWVFDSVILKEMLKFGFPLEAQYVMYFVFSRTDTIVIGSLLGTAGVAYYEVARKFPDSLFQLFDVFNSVYFPVSAKVYANEKKENTESLINNSIRLLTFLAAFGALITVLFGKDIILLFFSDKYLVSYGAFVLLMIGLTLKYLDNLLGYSLIAIGDPAKPLIVNVVRATVNSVGNLIFLPLAGFGAAAVVSVVSNIAAIPVDIFYLVRRRLQPRMLEYLKPMSAFGVIGLGFLAIGSPSIFLKIGLAILYFPMCLLLSVFTPKDISMIFAEVRFSIEKALGKQALDPANPD
jgi:O-antigen/teichoic acid export membrane protein